MDAAADADAIETRNLAVFFSRLIENQPLGARRTAGFLIGRSDASFKRVAARSLEVFVVVKFALRSREEFAQEDSAEVEED